MHDKVTLQNNINSGAPPGTSIYQNGAGVFIRTAENLVERQAEFIMKGGTIRGNTNNVQTPIACGGGVFIAGFGIFTMEGGSIMDNTAFLSGGGFHTGSRGTFIKTGGIIYGSEAPEGYRNTALEGAGTLLIHGHAVCVALPDNPSFRFRDDTVREDDFLSYIGLPAGNGVFGKNEKWQEPGNNFLRNLIIVIFASLALVSVVVLLVIKKAQVKRMKAISDQTWNINELDISTREKEVFEMLLSDLSLKQISADLGLTYAGVTFHTKKIYGKLGVKNRTELLVKYGRKEKREKRKVKSEE